MRNRNNNGRHTIWTEHFTIRSYLKDFSEFNQGSVDLTVQFTGSADRGPFQFSGSRIYPAKNLFSINLFRKTLFEVHFLVTYPHIAYVLIAWGRTCWSLLSKRVHSANNIASLTSLSPIMR